VVVRRGDVLVPLDRNPLETWLLGLCVLSGAQSFAVRPDHLPVWAAWAWYGLLVLGGIAGLVGAYWRDAITGVLIVRAAMIPVGTGAYLWAAALYWTGGTGVIGAAVIASFGLAAHWRAVQITRHTRSERKHRR
jgi:hypothetical protein